jgi:hypothetical protein
MERKEPDSDAEEEFVGDKIQKQSCLVQGAGQNLQGGPGGFTCRHVARPQFISKRPKHDIGGDKKETPQNQR